MSIFHTSLQVDNGELVETAWCNAWSSLGYHSECNVSANDKFLRICTPSSPDMLLNSVMRAHGDENNVFTARQLSDILEPFRRIHSPYQWWVRLGAEPSGLRMLLAESGMIVWSSFPGMVLPLQHSFNLPLAANLTVQIAATQTELDAAHHIICQVFGISPEPMRKWVGNNPYFTILLAYARGLPVGAMACQIRDGIAGVFHVATLPHCRRQGVASSMMAFAIQYAKSQGVSSMALTASSDAEYMYRKMGFMQACNFEFWMPGPQLMSML